MSEHTKQHALSKYEEDFPERATEYLAKGKSFAALAALFDISEDTLMNWRNSRPDFDDACKRGRAKGQAWWEDNSDANMDNKDYSSVRYIFKMKSQYKLRDGNEPSAQPPGINLTALVGIDGSEHTDLVNQIVSDARNRGEITDQ